MMGSQHATVVATTAHETWITSSWPWKNGKEPWHRAHPPSQKSSWASPRRARRAGEEKGWEGSSLISARGSARGKGTVIAAQLPASAT